MLLSAHAYLSRPSLVSASPVNTLESGGTVAVWASVPFVLRRITFSQIFAAIIEHVSILVIALFSFLALKDLPVHGQVFPWLSGPSYTPTCEKTTSLRIPRTAPVETSQPIKIGGIYHGNFSLRQWDKSVGFIKRLSNCVSIHAVLFSHRSTSNGSLQLGRYLTTGEALASV